MRRSAVSLAVVAVLLAPIHALAAVGSGCAGGRTATSCCCPMAGADDSERDRDKRGATSIEDTCCCELQPASQPSPVSPASVPSSPCAAALAPTERVTDVAATPRQRLAKPPTRARGPPPPGGPLLGQRIALLL